MIKHVSPRARLVFFEDFFCECFARVTMGTEDFFRRVRSQKFFFTRRVRVKVGFLSLGH